MSNLLKEIQAGAAGLAEELVALRRDFHQHPELSNEEERTGRKVAGYLENLGLEVRRGLAGAGVLGILRGARPGKVVAFRADMDALPLTEKVDVSWRSRTPGVMHACGHDFHLSIALGAAKLLTGLRDRLAGEVRFIFQPAEEISSKEEDSGAARMVAAGVLEDPPVNAVLALHVAPHLEAGHIWYCQEVVMAGAERLVLTVTGKAAHGATPHRGVDAILTAAQFITQLQGVLAQGRDQRRAAVLTFGTITGGVRFNILAEQVTLEGSLRYLEEAVRREVLEGARRLAQGLSRATGADIRLDSRSIYPILKNDPDLAEKAVGVLRRVFEAPRLKKHLPAMGSEDFSYFARKSPAFYFFLGVRPPGGKGHALHSPEFNPDEAALPWGLKAAAGLLACLSEPEFIWPG